MIPAGVIIGLRPPLWPRAGGYNPGSGHARTTAVQLPDDQRVAIAEPVERLVQTLPGGLHAADKVFDDLTPTCLPERVHLRIRILPGVVTRAYPASAMIV